MEGGPPSLWATLVTTWSATLGACWSWGWAQTPSVPAWVPPPSLGCGAEDGCHCSCDKELRHIMDLQAEVWALRCLLLAGLLLLGFATSTAGLLGFLAGVCRRCGRGVRGRTPGERTAAAAPEREESPLAILVRYENDPHGFFWHHRLLLFRVSDDMWICLTPDHDLVRVKLLDSRHEVLERRAPFPAHLANQVYAHDPIGGAALAAFRRRARLRGQLLGVGQVDAIECMIWVVAEPLSHRFGEIIDAALMDDEGRGTGFDQKGVAVLDGEEFFVQKIAASGLADFKRGAKADMGDVRTLGDRHDEVGLRTLRLSEAVALMCDVEQPNFPLAGVRSVKEFLNSVASGLGNMTSYQAEWERLSGVGEGSAVNHVRRNLCEVIRLMHSWDQVDVSMLASAELLLRWLIQAEIAVERNPRHPDYSGLDIVISAPVNAVGRASTSKFNTWVTDRLKERATIWKHERLYREEQKQTRKGDGKGSGSLDPSSKRHTKKKDEASQGRGGRRWQPGRRQTPPAADAHVGSPPPALEASDPFPLHLLPTAVQCWMLQNVARRVEAYGDCPTDLTEESSLAEILDSRGHYGMGPKNLASFDFDKVKILHRGVHASDLIERDEAEVEKDRAEGQGFSPYWDPALRRSRDLRKLLYQRLSQQGHLTWRRRLKGRAGIFVVKKKDGLQRLIIDARAANRAHRPPPTTRLGSSRCMADLGLSDPRLKASGFGGLGSGSAAGPAGLEGDVGGCFYNFTIPELASWFGFEGRFDTAELDDVGCRPATVWDDAVGAESKTLAGGPDQIMREMQPAPILKPGKCVTGVYVDNVQVIGGCKSDTVKQMTEIENSFGKDNIPFDIESSGEFEMQTLGLVYHWRGRRLRHVTRRVWRTYLAGHALLRRRKLHGHALQCWLGRAVNLNQLCPEAVSALNACCRFVDEALEAPKRTWPSVKSEIRCAMNLLFLVEADLGAKFSDEVYCGDSSTRGYALHVAVGGPDEIREAWKLRERWRYRDVSTVEGQVSEGLDYVQGGAPGSAAGPMTAFGQALRSRAEARPRPRGRPAAGMVGRAKVILDSGVPALADGWTRRRRCHLVAADRWRWQDERINLKEARVALMGLRRHCRSVRLLGSKLLTLSDIQLAVGAFEKGRSSAGLRALCRRAAAYRLRGQIAWRLRYIETDRNPSDFDSRQWGTKRTTGQPTLACERRPRPAAPPGQAAAAVGPAGKAKAIDPRGRLSSVADTRFSFEGELNGTIDRDAGRSTRAGRQRPPGTGRPLRPSAPRRVGPTRVPRRVSLVMATVRAAAGLREFEVYAQAMKLGRQPPNRLDDSLIVDDVAPDLMGHNLPLMGAAVPLQTDAYTRPSEAVELRRGQILPPSPAAKLGARYGIVIAPSERCGGAKTGGQDDNLLVGDVARPWLTDVLRILRQPKAANSQELFDFTLLEYEREIKKAADRLGYSPLGMRPHVFRHSKASNDKVHNRRTLKEIQKRGRWVSSASVARYDGALVLQELRKMPQQKQKLAARKSKQLPQRLFERLRHK
ncbi:unnamed protein product [Prorocentrum cordatum]|uniref:Tyr recombinase domain-containing protein n=1 Tax=Prorocentrum cordatum TaxID=2364126 RepID=A0ABN9VQW8_9DINO|nr:unnamed protein product [Polarella glacialis]